jgi:hypothetical protein
MWPVLWRVIETLLILYTIVSYFIVGYSLFIIGGEKAKEIPMATKLLFTMLAPFVLVVAIFVPIPEDMRR